MSDDAPAHAEDRPGNAPATPPYGLHTTPVPVPATPSPAELGSTASNPADPAPAEPNPPAPTQSRRRITAEIWLLLGVSLGQSAVYAILQIIQDLSAPTPLGKQSTALNVSQAPNSYLDLAYQLANILFAVLPAFLALYLLSARGRSVRKSLGIDGSRPWKDLGWGTALAAGIGIPGLAFYVLGRALGITVQVQASALNSAWWTIPVLILSALQNGILEEVIVVGYLYERTRDLGWNRVKFVVASSLLRGSYHLYQGIGPFFGNAVMGVVFSCFYMSKWGRKRVIPLVIAHTILDIVSFVGYALLPADWKTALGIG